MKRKTAFVLGICVIAALLWFVLRDDAPEQETDESIATETLDEVRTPQQPESESQATIEPAQPDDTGAQKMEGAETDEVAEAETTLQVHGVVYDTDNEQPVTGIPVFYARVPADSMLGLRQSSSDAPTLMTRVRADSEIPEGVQLSNRDFLRLPVRDTETFEEWIQGTIPLSSLGQSGHGGEFILEEIEPGTYAFTTATAGKYMASGLQTVEVSADRPAPQIRLPVQQAGFLEGHVLLNGEPLGQTQLRVQSYPNRLRLEATTDRAGRYELRGVEPFEGNLRGVIRLADGTERESLIVPVSIEAGKTTPVDFDFAVGTATIEGRVYRVSDGAPLQCGLNLLWQYADGEGANRDRVEVRTDPDGYYIAENLLPGSVLVEAFADFGGTLKHRKRVEISAGDVLQVDFPFEETYITVNVSNIPTEARTKAVVALPDEYDVPSPMTSWEQYMQIEDDMVAVGFIRNGKGHLDGLPPGRYTVVASALPTGPYFQDYISLDDEFLNRVRRVSTYVDLTADNPNITVDLDFQQP